MNDVSTEGGTHHRAASEGAQRPNEDDERSIRRKATTESAHIVQTR